MLFVYRPASQSSPAEEEPYLGLERGLRFFQRRCFRRIWWYQPQAEVSNRSNWIFCFKCKQWGKHRANECKFSKAQIRELTPMDESMIPSSEPYDHHFNLPITGGLMSTISMDSKN